LAGLLWAEAGKRRGPMLVGKGALSALFVLVALLASAARPDYHVLVLAGLVLGLTGDICLALPGAGAFRAGLAAFLLGHLLYVAAFVRLAPWAAWLDPWLALPGLAALAVFLWLRPHAGRMLIPVTLYIAAISLMLAGAWAVFRLETTAPAGAWCVLAGALFFYLSDLCVARQRFVSEGFGNRLLGLPLYYAGQFLLAWSVGLIG
jgi:uncharacterized membrane protein YhhN